MKKRICFVLVLLLIAFPVFPGQAQGKETGSETSSESVYAADFILKDLNGRDVKLSDYKGRVILLSFMATWCRDCLASIPALKAIYNRYHEKGLVLMNINIEESLTKVAAYSGKHSLPYPTLLDSDGKVSRKYGVGGVPVKALIDRQGRIICWNCRSLDSMLEKQFETPVK